MCLTLPRAGSLSSVRTACLILPRAGPLSSGQTSPLALSRAAPLSLGQTSFLALLLAALLSLGQAAYATLPENHVSMQSKYSVALTVERIERMLKQTSVRIYGIIDYQALAKQHGRDTPPMQTILFAGGRDSIKLLQHEPTVALDLPLRVLVHEDERGVVWITYHKADFLIYQHDLSENNIAAQHLADGLHKLVKEVAN